MCVLGLVGVMLGGDEAKEDQNRVSVLSDIQEVFGEVRSILQAGVGDDVESLSALLELANELNATYYQDVFLPYLSSFAMPEFHVESLEEMARVVKLYNSAANVHMTFPRRWNVTPQFNRSELAELRQLASQCVLVALSWQARALDKDILEALIEDDVFASLRALDLSLQIIDPMMLVRLIDHRASLSTLTIARVGLIHSGLRLLLRAQGLSRVTALNLESNDALGQKGAQTLAKSPQVATLRRLNMSRCKIGDRGVEALARSAYLTQLDHLELSYNGLRAPSCEAIAAMDAAASMVALNLSGNRLDAQGIHALRDGSIWPKLTRLNLAHNRLDVAALVSLMEVNRFPALKVLNIGNNQALSGNMAQWLEQCGPLPLEALHLCSTPLVRRDFEALSASAALPRLRRLCLRQTNLTEADRRRIEQSSSLPRGLIVEIESNPCSFDEQAMVYRRQMVVGDSPGGS